MERNDYDYFAGILVGVFLADLIDDHRDKIKGWFCGLYYRVIEDIANSVKEGK